VHDLEIMEPMKLETQINQLAGVVTVGIFAPMCTARPMC
jgi:ribose 5-phosphate isomerase A